MTPPVAAVVRDAPDGADAGAGREARAQQRTGPARGEGSVWRLMIETLSFPIVATHADGRVAYLNRPAAILLGPAKAVDGRRLGDLADFRDLATGQSADAEIQACLDSGRSLTMNCDVRPRRPKAVETTARIVVTPLSNGPERIGNIVVIEDLGRMGDLMHTLEHRARRDALTRLLNREAFLQHLDDVVARSHPAEEHALLFLDLDCFKDVNDRFGHAAGDVVLREVAAVFRDVVRQRDPLARLGGDEFALLLERCPRSRADRVAADLRDALRTREFAVGDTTVRLDVSIGVSMNVDRRRTAAQWIEDADQACYIDKRLRRNAAVAAAASPTRAAPSVPRAVNLPVFLYHQGSPIAVGTLLDAVEGGLFVISVSDVVHVAPGNTVEVGVGVERGGLMRYHRFPVRVVHRAKAKLRITVDASRSGMAAFLDAVLDATGAATRTGGRDAGG